MKILNLYAGIGGNRKLWGDEHDVTAVEINDSIIHIYKDFFPKDEVVLADAHQYLLEHYSEFDFIWSSPPCPSHSMFRKHFSMSVGAKPIYPDMKLYEEILFLQGYFKGKYVVENVKSWYKPLIEPQLIQRHYFWTNFAITPKEFPKDSINLTGGRHQTEKEHLDKLQRNHNIDISSYNGINKRTVLRNMVNPGLGLYILETAISYLGLDEFNL